MVVRILLMWLVVALVSVSSVLVEVDYRMLTSDVAVVFHLEGKHVCFCIVLLVLGVLVMPLNSLYCTDVVF